MQVDIRLHARDPQVLTGTSRSRRGDKRGKLLLDFGKAVGPEIEKICGAGGKALAQISPSQFRKRVTAVLERWNPAPKGREGGLTTELADFSAFWSSYHLSASREDDPLAAMEIPGQYSGSQPPQPSSHVMLDSIDRQILTMKSLRKPKRVTLHGSDQASIPPLLRLSHLSMPSSCLPPPDSTLFSPLMPQATLIYASPQLNSYASSYSYMPLHGSTLMFQATLIWLSTALPLCLKPPCMYLTLALNKLLRMKSTLIPPLLRFILRRPRYTHNLQLILPSATSYFTFALS